MTKKNEDLFSEAPKLEDNDLCDRAGLCLHVGEDCNMKGATDREYACFEAGAEPGEGVVDASASIPEIPETVTSSDTSRPFIRRLPVGLSEEELAERGSEMARLIGLHTKATLDLKAYTKGAKAVIDKYEAEYIELAMGIESGTEERDVQCFWRFNSPAGTKTLFRCDTGAEVETTAMTADEMQQDFNFQADKSVENVTAMVQEGATDEQEGGQEASEEKTEGVTASEEKNASEGGNLPGEPIGDMVAAEDAL